LKKYVIPAAILLFAAAGWFYGRRPEIPQVPFAKVVRETLVSTLPTNGKVEPFEWSAVRAEGPGIIDRVLVHEGQPVRKGDLVGILRLSGEQPDLAAAEAQIAQAQARLAEIERGGHSAELAEIESGLRRTGFQKEAAQHDLDSLSRLAEKKAATKIEVDAARNRVNAAQIEIEALTGKRAALIGAGDRSVAEAQLKQGRAAATAVRKRAAQSEIRSPLSGVVYSVPARQGAYVGVGDLIASIGKLDKLRVRVYVDEPELGRVAIGQPVKITWDALPGASWSGVVDQVPSEVVALGSRQVGEVRCVIENADGKLVPGTNVNAEIRTSVAVNALTVPKECVRREGAGSIALVLTGDRLSSRKVTLGTSSATRTQITAGLNEGDPVALPVEFPLKDGDRVRPVYP
jgi:HlyD family secretion protein